MGGNLLFSKQIFVELFNEHYINIVEYKSSGLKYLSVGNSSDSSQEEMTVKKIFMYLVMILAFEKSKNYVSLKKNFTCHTQAQMKTMQ